MSNRECKKSENYKFFQNVKCEFFPCHNVDKTDNFNCLFCYCPLYALGEDCGGNYSYMETGIKDCSKCLVPHRKDSFEYINKRFNDIMELAKKK